ncbi:MAG: hypothetical protein ACFFDW_02500 [Candidatus Thorarchaeota archaeon]
MLKSVSFLVIMEEKIPEANFSLKDLPSASKIDVVCRNILSVFPRENDDYSVVYYALFTRDTPTILQVKSLPNENQIYDEIAIASLIKEARQDLEDAILAGKEISFRRIDNLHDFLEQEFQQKNTQLIYLHEQGEFYKNYFETIINTEKVCFILGGRRDISVENEEIIEQFNPNKINLGPISYLASTCIIKTLYEIDKELKLL